MKMDRNLNEDGSGKYAIVNMRKLNARKPGVDDLPIRTPDVEQALRALEAAGCIECGQTGGDNEFFLIKLKDLNAQAALKDYAASIEPSDPEFAGEVAKMADRSGPDHPRCRAPD